jgi:RNA polymerase sigma-70 factor (ECF subfamily)
VLRAVPPEGEAEVEGPPTPDHADEIAGTTDVSRALARLPVDQRAVLVLHDVRDVPYEEVARILSIPLGTVRSRLHRGRIALARELGIETGREQAAPSPSSEGHP